MKISRHGIVERPNTFPHIAGAVVHGDTVYLQGITADPGGDVASQTKQVLERIDALLALAGTDKSKLLSAQVWLSDIRLFEAHNVAWNAWVDRDNPPARACVRADLVRPGLLVEIMVTAAR
jgi:enamine deaminase RidA (YjgF/YER057c/UK114 family)